MIWFNRAYESLYEDERLTQLVFGLEQLLLRDESSERSYLSFKMSLRGAWLLGNSGEERRFYYETLRQGYRLRNSVVHGQHPKPLEETAFNHKIEDCLRKLILKWLDNPELFEPKRMNDMILGI